MNPYLNELLLYYAGPKPTPTWLWIWIPYYTAPELAPPDSTKTLLRYTAPEYEYDFQTSTYWTFAIYTTLNPTPLKLNMNPYLNTAQRTSRDFNSLHL